MEQVRLKKGRDKAARNCHPWVFSGAVDHVTGSPENGDVVAVLDQRDRFIAYGTLNRQSQIAVRLLSWREDETIDRVFWQRRIREAISRRSALADDPRTTAYRLIHAESDLLPGLVVDRYGEWLVVQLLTLGVERQKAIIVDALREALAPRGIYERSDVDVRAQEGLEPTTGTLDGEPPPETLEVLEGGHRFLVDLAEGQKTGFYLDQRENRAHVASLARGQEILNAFSYTGAFSVYAAAAGAGPITNLDASEDALALARRQMQINDLDRPGDTYDLGDVFEVLRLYRDQGRNFDLIVLDPPKFAPTRRHVPRASRAYKDINLLALKLLRPGGTLVTFSCSGGISRDLFQKIVFGASIDAGRDVQILASLAQGADHPILLSFPESAYLKGLVCRVLA